MKKNRNDLIEDSISHLKFIIKSALEFDNGERESMLHVTTSLRALFKNHKRSGTISILRHFEISDMEFIDIAGIGNPISLAPMSNCLLTLNDYLPNLKTDGKQWIPFEKWYDDLVLFAPNLYSFSRKDIIKNLGEKYVQHVDKNVIDDFHDLFKNTDNFVGWVFNSNGLQIRQPNIIYSVLRMICHEIIVSLDKIKVFPLDFESIYFTNLRNIKPYSPFGNFNVFLINQSSITLGFYCKKNGINYKLPLTGEYSLANHRENVPNMNEYITDLVDKRKSKIVYNYLKEKVETGKKEFTVNEYIDIKPETFAAVHNPTKKYQEVERILLQFNFTIKIEKSK